METIESEVAKMMGKQIIAQPAKVFGQSRAGNMAAMGVIGLILAQGACWEGIKPFALPFLALVMVRDKQQGIAVFLGICCGSLPLGYGGELIATILAAAAIILLICWWNNFWQQRDEIALLAMVFYDVLQINKLLNFKSHQTHRLFNVKQHMFRYRYINISYRKRQELSLIFIG